MMSSEQEIRAKALELHARWNAPIVAAAIMKGIKAEWNAIDKEVLDGYVNYIRDGTFPKE